ncbi:MAG: response regulator [Magnetococcales bacterium]|nr:response regulator [Magnetococcales bacterium]
MMADQEIFITSKQASDVLGVTLPTIHDWVRKGMLKAWRTQGGHRRIAKSSVDAILNQRMADLETPGEHPKLTVMVVEDDPVMMAFYRSMVQGWPFPTALTTSSNGYQALIEIGQQIPDLIITDLAMPEMNGFRMVESILAHKAMRHLEIVAVSSLSDADIKAHGGLSEKVKLFKKPPPVDLLTQIAQTRAKKLHVQGA